MDLLARLLVSLVIAADAEAPARPQVAFIASGKTALPDGWAGAGRDGFSVRVRELTGSERAEFLWKIVAAPSDPFAGVGPEGPVFRTFLLEAENQGEHPALMNPSFFVLKTGEERRWPLGYTQAYSDLLYETGEEGDIVRLAPLLAETSIDVPPGARVVRLLVFERVPAGARSLDLDLPEIRVGGKDLSAHFRFVRPKTPR